MANSLRPLSAVPRLLWLLMASALLLQLSWRSSQSGATVQAQALPAPPPIAAVHLASLGEPIAMAKGWLLYLQAFEDQPGISLPWRSLDYDHLASWLETGLALDPRSQYALVAASEVYAGVSDPQRTRRMLDFVAHSFASDPARRWPAMAQATLTAKHQLHDLPLALAYARQLRLQTANVQAPAWVREMEAFTLEDMGQLESAQIVLGGLMASGQISDPHELAFLARRLDTLAQKKN